METSECHFESMASMRSQLTCADGTEFPPRGNLRKMMEEQPLPGLTPGLIDPNSMSGDEPTRQAQAILDQFNAAVASNDANALQECFYPDQAYWKDSLALTYHLRTFKSPDVISASFIETKVQRGIPVGLEIDGGAIFLSVTPILVS